MDYGYQLLRHVVQQVFGNLAQAARITVLPIVIGYAICAGIISVFGGAAFFDLIASGGQLANFEALSEEQQAEITRMLLTVAVGFLFCIPVLLFTYAWAAVGWHRYVLLEEYPTGFVAHWNSASIRSYAGAVIRLVLMLMVFGIAASIAAGIVVTALPFESLAVLFFFGIALGFTWVGARLGLILPSASLGEYMKLGESWEATRPVSSAILLPIVVVPLAFSIANTLFGFLPIIGSIAGIVLLWLQMLMNLALMTTLYGNLVEGRPLN